MKTQHARWLVVLAILTVCGFTQCHSDESAPTPVIEPEHINVGWRFMRGDDPDYKQTDFNDGTWRTVSLPHDWSIEDIPGTQSPFSAEASDAALVCRCRSNCSQPCAARAAADSDCDAAAYAALGAQSWRTLHVWTLRLRAVV